MKVLLILLLASRVFAGTPDPVNPLPQAGATFFSALTQWLKNELYNERRETQVGSYFVVCGCVDHSGPGLTHTPDACTAYVSGYRVTESQSITYSDNSTCYVVLEQGTTGNITADDGTLWTRDPNSHYMLNCTGGGHPPVTGMKVWTATVSGGAVTAITDTRPLYPVDTADITDGAITRAKLATGTGSHVTYDPPDPQTAPWGGANINTSESTTRTLVVTTTGGALQIVAALRGFLPAVVSDPMVWTVRVKIDGVLIADGIVVNDAPDIGTPITPRSPVVIGVTTPVAGAHTITVTGQCSGTACSVQSVSGRLTVMEML